jgi:riboflavin biosynthesis pyrimidine reductase
VKLLFERDGLPTARIPPELERLYGGDLGFAQPCVYANFVASVDGVVALPVKEESGGIISKSNPQDQFVMGLLRAFAGTVLVGAGTFRKGDGQIWDAAGIYPAQAAAFSDLRRKLNLSERPRFAVLSASGQLDATQPALRDDAVIITTSRGAERLGKGGPSVLIAEEPIRLPGVLASLPQPVLCEGGPTLIAQLIAENLLNELFLTRSPFLFGRQKGDDRKALVEGELLDAAPLELLSVRSSASYLFLRYALSAKPASAASP